MTSDSTKRFSDRVQFYVRSRPGYPAALLEFCRERLLLKPSDVIADIGSGTGILSKLFLKNGNEVYCIEPNLPMREAGDGLLRHYPNYHAVDGTAEATTLADASVDFIAAGQAFHWFDPARSSTEFRRILKPGGWVALIWNERRAVKSGFNAAYDRFIDRFTGDRGTAAARGGSIGAEAAVKAFFGQRGFAVEGFANFQILNWHGLLDRVYSSSYMPMPDDPKKADMIEHLRPLFDQFAQEGTIRIEYETRLYFGKL